MHKGHIQGAEKTGVCMQSEIMIFWFFNMKMHTVWGLFWQYEIETASK